MPNLRVNVNKATLGELMKLPDIGEARANLILSQRENAEGRLLNRETWISESYLTKPLAERLMTDNDVVFTDEEVQTHFTEGPDDNSLIADGSSVATDENQRTPKKDFAADQEGISIADVQMYGSHLGSHSVKPSTPEVTEKNYFQKQFSEEPVVMVRSTDNDKLWERILSLEEQQEQKQQHHDQQFDSLKSEHKRALAELEEVQTNNFSAFETRLTDLLKENLRVYNDKITGFTNEVEDNFDHKVDEVRRSQDDVIREVASDFKTVLINQQDALTTAVSRSVHKEVIRDLCIDRVEFMVAENKTCLEDLKAQTKLLQHRDLELQARFDVKESELKKYFEKISVWDTTLQQHLLDIKNECQASLQIQNQRQTEILTKMDELDNTMTTRIRSSYVEGVTRFMDGVREHFSSNVISSGVFNKLEEMSNQLSHFTSTDVVSSRVFNKLEEMSNQLSHFTSTDVVSSIVSEKLKQVSSQLSSFREEHSQLSTAVKQTIEGLPQRLHQMTVLDTSIPPPLQPTVLQHQVNFAEHQTSTDLTGPPPPSQLCPQSKSFHPSSSMPIPKPNYAPMHPQPVIQQQYYPNAVNNGTVPVDAPQLQPESMYQQQLCLNYSNAVDSRAVSMDGLHHQPADMRPQSAAVAESVSNDGNNIPRGFNSQGFVPAPKLPTFSGEDFKGFIRQLEALAQTFRWDEEEKILRMFMALRGKALEFYTTTIKDTNTYEEIRKKFRSRFDQKDPPSTIRAQLQTITQLVDEDVEEFAARVSKLVHEGYPDNEDKQCEEYSVDHFLNGLKDKAVALDVKNLQIKELSKAIQKVRTIAINKQSIFGDPKVQQLSWRKSTHTSDSEDSEPKVRMLGYSRKPNNRQKLAEKYFKYKLLCWICKGSHTWRECGRITQREKEELIAEYGESSPRRASPRWSRRDDTTGHYSSPGNKSYHSESSSRESSNESERHDQRSPRTDKRRSYRSDHSDGVSPHHRSYSPTDKYCHPNK